VEYREEGELIKETFSITDDNERQKLTRPIASGNIETMHTKEATLEEIFIKVTGRGLK